MIETPQIVQTHDQHVALIPLLIPRDQIMTLMPPALEEIFGALKAQDLAPTGPWFTHHLTLLPEHFDFEVCVPVDSPVTAAGRVVPSLWPAGSVARTVFTGDYSGLMPAWQQVREWLIENRLKPASHIYERYLITAFATPNPAEWTTELSWPLLP